MAARSTQEKRDAKAREAELIRLIVDKDRQIESLRKSIAKLRAKVKGVASDR